MIQSIIRGVLFLGSLLLTFCGLFYMGRREGKKQVEQDWAAKKREEEIINEYKKEMVENETANSSLDDLVAANNKRHGTRAHTTEDK